jgi:hypothetical protein
MKTIRHDIPTDPIRVKSLNQRLNGGEAFIPPVLLAQPKAMNVVRFSMLPFQTRALAVLVVYSHEAAIVASLHARLSERTHVIAHAVTAWLE